MKVPEVANRMRAIADKLKRSQPSAASELLELAEELRRRPSVGTRAPATSTSMTPELEQEIRDYAEANPGLSQQAIAEAFNVNHGRVSEAIRGKRL